jgi:hypothetical protein
MRTMIALIGVMLSSTACYRAVPVEHGPASLNAAAEPVEQLVVDLPVGDEEAMQLLRRAMFESGLMVSKHDRRAHWMLAEAGAVDDPILRAMREVFLVASYEAATDATTRISIGALERTLQTMGASRGTGTPQVLTNVRRLSARTARETGVWERARAIADYLVSHGGLAVDVAPK